MTPDFDKVDRIIRETAQDVIMPRFRKLGEKDIREKSPRNLVTIADLESETILSQRLSGLAPGSTIVGEEGVEENPGMLDALKDAGPVWIIDPLDGTNNFVNGKPCFAVIISYCRGGETLAGWIFDPVANVMVQARKGEGAWAGERRLKFAPPPPLDAMTGRGGKALKKRITLGRKNEKRPERLIRYGCVGREYQDLCLGWLHFACYQGHLKPWDHGAGVLIHSEAGGHSAINAEGTPYSPSLSIKKTTLLLAPDKASWKNLFGLTRGEKA
ncbi:MAG TPA: inositol monophosphatase [Rhodospirillales bacterium]|nr:inositol monophosphatase [Rhodospirillales bacterium]